MPFCHIVGYRPWKYRRTVPAENNREQKLLAQRLLIAVVAPVGLLLLVGLILAFQVVRLTDTAHWVDHTDEVISRISEIQTQIVDHHRHGLVLPASCRLLMTASTRSRAARSSGW